MYISLELEDKGSMVEETVQWGRAIVSPKAALWEKYRLRRVTKEESA